MTIRLFMQSRQRGSAMLVILPLIILLAVLLSSLLIFSRKQRVDAGKQSRQQSATAAVENRLGGVVSAGRTLMETNGVLPYAAWTQAAQEASSELTNGYQLTSVGAGALMDMNGGGNIAPWPTAAYVNLANDSTTILSSADDLFRGARAQSQSISLKVEAVRNSSALTLGDEGQNEVAGAVRWTATESLRAVPLSQFSCFSGGADTLDANVFTSGLGRTYIGGDASLTGNLTASYRVVVAGNATLGAGATLTAKAMPTDQATTVMNTSSTDPTWRDTVRPTDSEAAVVTGGEVPASVAIPATVAQMVATPTTDLGSRNIYRLSTQASRVVHLTAFDSTSGQAIFVVTDASGAVVSNPGPWRAALDPRNTAGGPAITFAYAEQYGAGTVAPSYYVYSDVPGSMLIIRQTRILMAPLSIATPLPMAVVNGFDDLVPGPNPNDPPTHLTYPVNGNSLISGAGQLAVWQE